MSFEWFIARRYLTARRKQAFISVITSISVLGITIGVMALIIAIALITGFQQDVQAKILGSTSHVMIQEIGGIGIAEHDAMRQTINETAGVRYSTPVVYDTVLIKGPYRSHGALLRGLDFDLEEEADHWIEELDMGGLPDPDARRGEVLLGRELAFQIGATLGDVVTILSSSSSLSPMGLRPRVRQYRVAGLFHTGLYEFDGSTALVRLDEAQDFFNLEDRVSLIQVWIDEIFDAPAVKEHLRSILPEDTYATTWMEMNKPLFSALKLEKQLMFFTITLIVLVAALNIIATLILMVMEKIRDIGILKALGATSRGIRRIFFYQGAMIGVMGTVIGTVLGLIWCWLANTFQLIRLPAEIYEIAFVPFRIQIPDLLWIIGVALLISFLSTLFPSQRASRVDPVHALKYE